MRTAHSRLTVIAALCFCLNSCRAQIADSNSLELVATIPLPNVNGRVDHLAYDQKHQLIFVAALGNNTVEVVDLKNKSVIHTIKNLSEPQGIVFMPETNSIFVANGENGECDFFSDDSFQKTAVIKLSGDADNVRYDSAGKKIYVGYGEGGIAIIDAATFKPHNDIKLSGHPEAFQIDKSAKRLFVNVPDEKEVDVIDLEKNTVTEKWSLTTATSNYPMSLDEDDQRLFIGCRHPAKLLVLDAHSGKNISSFDIGTDADDIFYDVITKQIFISCGGGYIDIFRQTNDKNYVSEGRIQSRPGTRTSLLIPDLNLFVVASPAGYSGDASLLVYRIK